MIGILSYNVPHRKTYDVLCLLKSKGYQEVTVYAVPLHYKKKFQPLYSHRPPVLKYMPDTKTICNNFQYEYVEGAIEDFSIPNNQIMLVCGAGIIPNEFIKEHKIINAHPGYIPLCRGLDAYKWAVYEGKPIGVTTHLLGEYVDAGEIIERRMISLNFNDTFHSVAQRVYENEVGMLVEAIEKINEEHEIILPEDNPVHKRMPHSFETRLLERFEKIIKNVPIEESKDR